MYEMAIYQVETKFGNIYIEPLFGNREEVDRVKIFDSDINYIDYIPIETIENSAIEQKRFVEEEYVSRINAFKEAETIRDLMDLITQDWITVTDNPFELQERLEVYCADEKRLLHEIVNNDYINQIGSHYILMGE
jgi:hypothetical protein